MKYMKQWLFITVLISAPHALLGTITKIIPRSQSLNAARQIVGWNNPDWGINRKLCDNFYTSMNLTFEYTSTFRGDTLTRCLFDGDLTCGPCGPALIVSGSQRNDRTPTDWLADYFGLPRDFKSTVSFNPRIRNYLLDFSFYAGLDQWIQGLYFRIHGPFVHTNWNMSASENIINSGTVGYFQGYFDPHNLNDSSKTSTATADLLNKSFLDYTNGCVPSLPDDITWQSLCCGKMFNECVEDPLTINAFGELRFVLGWNFLNNADGDYHLGVGIYTAAPTGTRPGYSCTGAYLFEPIVGNGKFWELGGQITAHHYWWHSETNDACFGFFFEGEIVHMFKTHQQRCFDLCNNGPNSRYMIAQRLTPNAYENPRLYGESDASLAFANEFAPVANITHRTVNVSIDVQADIAISFQYQKNDFSWDVGYNFWGRSCECIGIDNCACDPIQGDWALKGDNRVYGFVASEPYPYPNATVTPVPVAATDSNATIHQGSNLRNGVDYMPIEPEQPSNFYADSAVAAVATVDSVNDLIVTRYADQSAVGDPYNQLYTSENPIIIQECDFNLQGSRGISNKVFTHFNWAWPDCKESNWTAYFGLGAEVEFGNTSNRSFISQPSLIVTPYDSSCNNCCSPCDSCCSHCMSCALTQWGLWLKVGASYN